LKSIHVSRESGIYTTQGKQWHAKPQGLRKELASFFVGTLFSDRVYKSSSNVLSLSLREKQKTS
jgi:hypothetical protein